MEKLTEQEKQELARKVANEVVLLLKIKSVLELHSKGLKAREIANLIPNTDKTTINHILYDYKTEFIVEDYVWKLKKKDSPKTHKASPKEVPVNNLLKKFYGNKVSASKEIKARISNLDTEAFSCFAKNLEKLNSNSKIPKAKDNQSGDIDYCLQLALLGNEALEEIERRSRIIYNHRADIVINFSCWNRLIKLNTKEFEDVMLCAKKLKKKHIIPILTCTEWFELITLLCEKDNFSVFSKNNDVINNSFSYPDFESNTFENWKKIVFLQGDSFGYEINKLKREKLERESLIRSEERTRQQRIYSAYRDRMIAEEKTKPTISSFEITRACTGNCSSCNRTECIEDRANKR